MVTEEVVDREDVIKALDDVNDPHVPVSLRRMGMLEAVSVSGNGHVDVRVCVPCLGCPGASMIESGIADRLQQLPGVTEVTVELGWFVGWDREKVDPDARSLMRSNGIQI